MHRLLRRLLPALLVCSAYGSCDYGTGPENGVRLLSETGPFPRPPFMDWNTWFQSLDQAGRDAWISRSQSEAWARRRDSFEY